MKIIHLETIDSTNKYLKREATSLDDLSFCDADYQTEGKGRTDRKWDSIKGENLTFSLLIKDELLINRFASISLLSASVIAKSLLKLGIKDVSIKWPNDVYVSGKKICGILLESSSINNSISNLILGIGLNVNQKAFSGDYSATSVFLSLGKFTSLETLKNEIYQSLLDELTLLKLGKSNYLSVCRELNYLKNKDCTAIQNNKKIAFRVIDINEDNSLLVQIGEKTLSINSGEISLIRN